MEAPRSLVAPESAKKRPHRPLWSRVLDRLLRETYGHPLSVELLAVGAVALLLSFLLYFLAPWLDDDAHRYLRRFLPWTQYLDWSSWDSFVVDHAVVFLAIAPPVIWLLLVHVAYSSVSSPVEAALLALRVASCLTVSFALTVLLAEFLSRRAMLALIALAYGSLGLLYSWSVPLWRWYLSEARTKGLVAFLPDSARELLLHTSLLEWMTDTSFSDKMQPFLPFLLPLTRAEQTQLLEQMPAESQILMTRPGLLPLLPQSVQEALLPVQDDSDSDQDNEFSSDKQRERALALLEGDSDSAEASREELLKPVTLSASGSAGFDFHRPEVVSTVRPPSSREQVLNEIVTSRIWSGCKDLVKVPAAKTLNRTAAMSSALLVLQLYASRGSRRAFLTFAQFIAASALSSVACCAIFLRLVQLLDLNLTAGRAVPLLRYARQYLLRNGNTGTPQLSAQAANDGGSVSLRAAASSVSVLAAALYVYRKTRR